MIPVPPQDTPGSKFTLLTNEILGPIGGHNILEVLFCSQSSSQPNQSDETSSSGKDDSNDDSGAVRLKCKNVGSDVIILPASTRDSIFPFKSDQQPFSYLQFDLEQLKEYSFIAIVDKAVEPHAGWVVAEFSSNADSLIKADKSLPNLFLSGLSFRFPASHPLMVDIKISALHSSLLAYKLHVEWTSPVMDRSFSLLCSDNTSPTYMKANISST